MKTPLTVRSGAKARGTTLIWLPLLRAALSDIQSGC